MKETKAKKSTYLRNFIIAVALSAAILAAGALWVLLSWRSALDITLTDLAGDPAALRGFTMRGQSYFDTAHTYWDLHDGYLDTSFALDPDESDDRYRYSAWGASHSTFYAVTPETRDEVNAAAQRVQVYDDNWQMQSTASHFRVMVEISMGSDVLRVALRDVVLDAPISVSANAEVPTTYLTAPASAMITRPISPTKWRIPTPITATLPGKFSRWATARALPGGTPLPTARLGCTRPRPSAMTTSPFCLPTAKSATATCFAPPPSSARWNRSTAPKTPDRWSAACQWMTA